MEIRETKGFIKRFKGFMFHKQKINYGLCFKNCNAIHTFFMRQPIDIVMTNKNHKVVFIKSNLKPWKIILPKKHAYYVYELPIGSTNNIRLNNTFK